MNKKQFLNWFIQQFNKDDNYITEYERLNNGLTNANVDYKQLKEHITTNYKTIAPDIRELNKIATQFKTEVFIDTTKCEALQHYARIKALPHIELKDVLSEDSKQKIIRMLAKYGKKPSFMGE